MSGESNMETYITICKINSQQEIAVWLRKLKKRKKKRNKTYIITAWGNKVLFFNLYLFNLAVQHEGSVIFSCSMWDLVP